MDNGSTVEFLSHGLRLRSYVGFGWDLRSIDFAIDLPTSRTGVQSNERTSGRGVTKAKSIVFLLLVYSPPGGLYANCSTHSCC